MIIRRLPSFPRWTSPFGELERMRREMGHLFDSLTGETKSRRASGVFPAINVSETGEALHVRAELPGVEPGKLDVNVENNTLTIAGERDISNQSEHASYHRREREWGTFRRSFTLPVRVDTEKVDARYVDGILTIELPKAAEARPRQISVKAGA